ncbi:alpha/beta hydrolase [Methylomonas sp. AM2-LC]|uniref:alpha/beta hydrolase n=1 Tax=Methylomonas sp. AM2-LC TaxID=3153301 RepID=UPI0032631AB0
MPSLVIKFLAVAILIYLGLCVGLYAGQRALLYHPTPSKGADVADAKLKLAVEGAELAITASLQTGDNALIYFGGNMEDVSWSLPMFSKMFPGYAIYLPHYRGYSDSTGQPSELALHNDALVLFDKIHARHKHVFVVGRSLGTGVAVRLASQRPVERLVLVTPYDSIEKVAEGIYPLFPISWLLIDKYESWQYAPKITAPTLLVAAEQDQVIPLANTENLYKSFSKDVATLKVIPGRNHNDIMEDVGYLEWLKIQ